MLKKTISLLLCLLMLVSAVPLAGLSASAAESEVPEGYTGIYNIEDLYCIRYALDGKYILMADIDMTEDTAPGGDWDNNGCGWAPIGENTSAPFTGVFDGNGHTVKGMRIDGIKTVAAGLFGCFSGEIKNLVFEDCAVSTTSTACTYCGVAAGYGLSGAKLTKVKVDGGTVSSSHSYTKNFNKNTIYVGGVAGCVDSSAAI
ncbi:MAG: hypothetical protein MJ177_09525, partial [Clostridia bacterium]|nr:hypothetical protein [Clostridia bacterium]